jgi:acetyl-CoA acetyltransferase
MSARVRHAIVGVGESPVGKIPDRTALDLQLEAAANAIADAGGKDGIDGVIACQPRREPQSNYSALLANRLGLQPRYINDISLSGVAPTSMVVNAVAAIDAGLCTTVLCIRGESRGGGGKRYGRLANGEEDFREPYGLSAAPILYGLAARRHMHEYGTTSRQLGAVAVACRKHACLNPNAQMHTPITLEDHQNSRFIADPFHLLDCSLVSDGAGAVIVTAGERAQDFPKPPVYVLGLGYANRYDSLLYADCVTTSAGVDASRQAYQMAGLSPSDVDLVEFYDCFTSVVVITLEDYGFCAKGEGGAFVENGRIELGGELPVNTHGGLLSQAHLGGMLHINEAVTQLRHEAGARQVADAEIAAVSGQCGEGGIHVSLLFGTGRSG